MIFNPEYLRWAAQAPHIRAVKDRAYALLNLQEGRSVIDLGCGPAIDTVNFAKLVGVTGRVVGVDYDPAMVAEANRIAASRLDGINVRHVAGNASSLGFRDDEFDACFSDRLFQHVPWSECLNIVREIRRVLKPRRSAVLIDSDWGTLSIAASDAFLERRIVQEHTFGFAHAFAGRHLLGLMKTAGFQDVSAETFDLQLSIAALRFLLAPTLARCVGKGLITISEAQLWYEGLEVADQYGLFFAHLSMVIASGKNGA
jgi:ubiquinone/menaquinone biosynthesis C-methylase UbiE